MTYTDEDVRRLPLAAAKDELLTELLGEPYDVSERFTSDQPHRQSHRRSHRRALRVVLTGVAVAAVATVGVVGVLDRKGYPPIAGGGSIHGKPAHEFSAQLVAMAERIPRILLDAPGWSIETVYGFGEEDGTLGFRNGDADLELNWYPADSYAGYFHDREDDPSIAHESTRLFDHEARLFTYSTHDHATMLEPQGRSFVEVRGEGMDERTYLAVTAQLRQVGVREFLDAMPDSVVIPGNEGAAAAKVLSDIPVPPGFEFKPTGDVDDAYQFGAAVTGQVFCSWIARYRAGDAATKREALTAMESSHEWKVLHDMNEAGDWPEAIWETADQIAAGDLRPETVYAQGLNCSP